ncbi:uncharacterized protein AB675_871 [Cyphellophora attinorum]|uniref:Vps72/YL1 C-terminal domain-containing protein n=1 Tax=Cyphellophora attinorum TaxID=1664694 RepID=A0A0N0NRV0_9EURO|nr:uncharacterized protein AB675_871 [Phialophora attinorum]KPI45518.1 hypothetical protein AB675_871 [Phialophora attinorum]
MADVEMADVATPASGSTSDNDSSDDEGVELLVTGRERRKTAGNRYQRELVQEEAENADEEDEVALLFAGEEDEVDEEFKSEASDEDAMSSSDDDDQGPNAGADEMDGEKELQKAAKAERATKRKAKDALTSTAALRKRPRIDPTAPKSAPKKPSKKKERVTWLPDLNNTGGRTSLRKQTIQHRATTIARLKQSEAQSKITKKIREERDRERALNAPKAMTQADRLAEAERTERRNAKSLNRWEATEKKRNEEQAAKLAALKNRKLEGPVISWRSAKSKYRPPKQAPSLPSFDIYTEDGLKKRGRKTKEQHAEMARVREMQLQGVGGEGQGTSMTPQVPFTAPPGTYPAASPVPPALPLPTQGIPQEWLGPPPPRPGSSGMMLPPTRQPSASVAQSPSQPTEIAAAVDMHNSTGTTHQSTPTNDASFLHGIFDYANQEGDPEGSKSTTADATTPMKPVSALGEEQQSTATAPAPSSELNTSSAQVANAEHAETKQPVPPATAPSATTPADAEAPSAPGQDAMNGVQVAQPQLSAATPIQPVPNAITPPSFPQQAPRPSIEILPSIPTPTTQPSQTPSVPPTPASPSHPTEEIFTTRNLLTLNSFDTLPSTLQTKYSVFFNTRKNTTKPTRHKAEICPITMLPAKYRDPATGIGYTNMHAYRVLKELGEKKFVWSGMLGCYVGREGGTIARGCVEGFRG